VVWRWYATATPGSPPERLRGAPFQIVPNVIRIWIKPGELLLLRLLMLRV
jgi:hypothetical protein